MTDEEKYQLIDEVICHHLDNLINNKDYGKHNN